MNHGLSIGIAFALLAPPLAAQTRPPDPTGAGRCGVQSITRTTSPDAAAREFLHVRYFGSVTHDRTQRVLDELRWHRSLASATRWARQKDRPIVLFQALGDLTGLC